MKNAARLDRTDSSFQFQLLALMFAGILPALPNAFGGSLYWDAKKQEKAGNFEAAFVLYQKAYFEKDKKRYREAMERVGALAAKQRLVSAQAKWSQQQDLEGAVSDLEKSLSFDRGLSEARQLLDDLKSRKDRALANIESAEKASGSKHYEQALRLLADASALFPKYEAISTLQEKVLLSAIAANIDSLNFDEAKRYLSKADDLGFRAKMGDIKERLAVRGRAHNYYLLGNSALGCSLNRRALEKAKMALEVWPEHPLAPELRESATEALVSSHIESARKFIQERQYREAIVECELAKNLAGDSPTVAAVKKSAAAGLLSLLQEQARHRKAQESWKESGDALSEILDIERGNPDATADLKRANQALVRLYLDEGKKYRASGDFGNALLRYMAVQVLGPQAPESGQAISDLKAHVRDRVGFRVGIREFENASDNPELPRRLRDGLFSHLRKNSVEPLEIVDLSADDWMSSIAERTGTQISKSKPISVFVDETVYPLKLETTKAVSAEVRKVQVGTTRVVNPRWSALVAQRNALTQALPAFGESHRQAQSDAQQKAFSTLLQMGEANRFVKAGGELSRYDRGVLGMNMLDTLFTANRSSEVGDAHRQASAQLDELDNAIGNTAEFLEEPRFERVESGGETHIKTAFVSCFAKVREFPTGKVIFSRRIEKMESASDQFRKGDSERGIVSDPLNLPSDIQMEERALSQLVRDLSTTVYDYLKNYGEGYYVMANTAVGRNDHHAAVERTFDFLFSFTSRYEHEAAESAKAYLIKRLAALVPKNSLDAVAPTLSKVHGPVRTKGKVVLYSNPSGAEIRIQGEDQASGRTPLVVDIDLLGNSSRTVRADLSKKGFRIKRIEFVAGLGAILSLPRIELEETAIPDDEVRKVVPNVESVPTSVLTASTPRRLDVPDDYTTIQGAMDAAEWGDTIVVKPGVYREAIVFKDGVDLMGTERDACRIEPVHGATAVITAIDCAGGSITNLTLDGKGGAFKNLYSFGLKCTMKDEMVVVKEAVNGGPALVAGVEPDAVIVGINGRRVLGDTNLVWNMAGMRGSSTETRLHLEIRDLSKLATVKQEILPAGGWWPEGIALIDSKPTVRNCSVTGLGGSGIFITGRGAAPKIISNWCKDNLRNGISVHGGSTPVLQGNVCKGNKFIGISIIGSDSHPTVGSNTCEDNNAGILVFGKGAGALLKGNRCLSNQTQGIALGAGADGIAEGNTCEANKGSGIILKGKNTRAVLKDNSCVSNEEDGITYRQGALGRAERNTCSNNNRHGILVADNGSSPEIIQNTCNLNGQSGIFLVTGAGGTIERNTCEENTYAGITVRGKGTNPTVNRNACMRNEIHGIMVYDGASMIAEENICERNKQIGIIINNDGSTATAKRNRCDNNGTWGFVSPSAIFDEVKDRNNANGNKDGDFGTWDDSVFEPAWPPK